MRYLIKTVLIIFILGATLFARDIATVTALNGKAFIKRGGTQTQLSLGDKLQESDTILTSDKTKVQIIFKDETIITLGKNSDFSISEYLFEDDKEVIASFTMLKGAMRTITGKIGKIAPDKFSVTTKTTTIGIRGTNFTVVVGEDGSHNVFCTFGAISVQVKGVAKTFVVRQGFYSHITADGKVEVKEFTPEQLKNMKKASFKQEKKEKKKVKEDFGDSAKEQPKTESATDNLIIKDITEQVREGAQKEMVTDVATEGILLSSYGYFGNINLNLGIKQDGSSIVNSGYVEIKGSDDRKFVLAPTSNFSQNIYTQFNNVIDDSRETTIDMAPEFNYFQESSSAIEEDYVMWGEWSIKYDEKSGDHTYEVKEHGLWVSGVPTNSSVVDAMQGTFIYNGMYKGYDCDNNGELVNGVATLYVDFGHDEIELLIEHGDDSALFDANPNISGNEFTVDQDPHNDGSGYAFGKFYGSEAGAAGGGFVVSETDSDGNTQIHAKGIYEVGNKTPFTKESE